MARKKKASKPRRTRAKTFRVTPAEKKDLLAAIEEADAGGSLAFDEAMVEVRRKTDEVTNVLSHDRSSPHPDK